MASDAEEVAEDYRHALEDLSSNMRFEISNLTVIARENTEHALAIAEVLQHHILKAPPNKKLPSLYVLDSIVKNVGTPYTLYFGRNLFKTFMESYAVVDHNIRRKMEEMLRTWKDPVPGSMDTRPVFSHELVRPIENALMKARAASMPQQGHVPGRPRSAMPPHRDTPTPPGMRGASGPAPAFPGQPFPHPNGGRPGEPTPGSFGYPGQPQQYPHHATPPQPGPPAPAPFQPGLTGPYGTGPAAPTGISVETLSNDIQTLIVAMRAEFSHNPLDASVQNRLRALLDLQAVVQRTSLPPDQLELIKNKVTELAAVTMRPSLAQSSAQIVPPQALRAAPVTPTTPAPASTPTPTPTPASSGQAALTLDSLLGPGALAALMARQSTTRQNSTPNPPYAQNSIRSPPPSPAERPQPPSQNAVSLLDRLRQAGMLPPPPPTNAGVCPGASHSGAPPPTTTSMLPPNIASLLSSSKWQAAQPGPEAPAAFPGLDAASLKQFRPEAVAALYDELGSPCTQCGRRFKTDAESKKKKMAHMDWHFRVHQRSTETERRGTHRSWYVDQQDWVRSREVVDSDHVAAPEEASKQAAEADKGPQYIPVPDPSGGVNNVCPICQEKFENKWLDTAQEWVWLDAVLVGNRAYHASCHAEATMDHESAPVVSRRTPEPILGKRKAETSMSSPKIRTMKTSA
ncbi:mRNA cleavage factor complex component Pcf11 [Ophiocordyceps sinensis CO18]|uniref:mRNA cleavage factor complex component Pcf11 n=1 Tax=Ophiocordyceps sinensis (strain Co18 / CGMCC 3.14243) TaxID=911162 RepID=T5A4Y7_OPHSC|nr:mRNA cleavage factor complex component Pcf11 [Ophiocordyceps sinensis CO18]